MTIDFIKGPQSENQYQNIVFHKKGGMGEIYLADDTINNERVAIKVIPIDDPTDEALISTEAKIALSLMHDRIVRTYSADTVELHGKKYFYFVMEYMQNGNLRELIERTKTNLELPVALEYMKEIAQGLEYAHSQIVNRDMKPENILVDNSNHLKICDFGLAKYVDSKTRTHTFKGYGTLPYMAPEGWKFDSNTVAMDIYSLGIIYFELLTLQIPYKGKSESDYRNFHLFTPFPNISDLRKELPIRLAEMISKMTAKRPDQRYTSVSEINSILDAISSDSENITVSTSLGKLADKARQRMEETKKAELAASKATDEKQERKKAIGYSIDLLLKRFIARTENLNEVLEQDKVGVTRGENSYLNLTFDGKMVSVSFFADEQIYSFIQNRKESQIRFQQQQYGMVMVNPIPPHLETDRVIQVGKAFVSQGNPNGKHWGFNLVLRKTSDEDIYGEWSAAWFDDDPLISLRGLQVLSHYANDSVSFYGEYEQGRIHAIGGVSVTLVAISDEHIDALLEKLFE